MLYRRTPEDACGLVPKDPCGTRAAMLVLTAMLGEEGYRNILCTPMSDRFPPTDKEISPSHPSVRLQ